MSFKPKKQSLILKNFESIKKEVDDYFEIDINNKTNSCQLSYLVKKKAINKKLK